MLIKNILTRMTKDNKIRNAAMLVIGDEILNGKIKDTNSQFFADYCFSLGVNLKKIAVVPDEEEDIMTTIKDFKNKYDFIVTSGGIGPTHDDITYPTIAKAFDLPLKLHQPTIDRMNILAENPPKTKAEGNPELKAQLRMADLPAGPTVKELFVSEDLWVPIVVIDSKVHIFPGIPALFRKMLECLRPYLEERVDALKLIRRFLRTTTPESGLAGPLSDAQNKYKAFDIKIGSYPHMRDHVNTVSIIGPENAPDVIQNVVDEIMPSLENGVEISAEEEAELK